MIKHFDECKCACHRLGGVHIIACCHTCPNCGKERVMSNHKCMPKEDLEQWAKLYSACIE